MPNPLADVTTWSYVINNVGGAKMDRIGASPVDLVVVDSEDRGLDPFDAADIARMKGANDKLVISYLSIGEAETYRDYWQKSWESNPPNWLAEENPEWAGNIKVAYWKPAWQAIILDWVDDIVDAGFDGFYLDIIDAYAWWEEAAPRHNKSFYRDAMVDFVAAIRARAETRMADTHSERDFAIIGQNGEDLADDPDYLAVVDGIGKEDLYFFYPNGKPGSFREVPKGWLSGSKELLEKAEAAGVEVLAVEYVPERFRDDVIGEIRKEMAYLKDLSAPLYLSTNRSLARIELSVGTDGRVRHWGDGGDDDLRGTPWADLMQGAAGRDRLFGYRGRDRLDGGGDNDRLVGGRGHDVLLGDTGSDRAIGGAGGDRFVFAPGDEALRIRDFGRGGDVIDLRGFGLVGIDAVHDAASRDHGALVIDLGGDRLVLDDTAWRDLSGDDFLF